MALWMSDFETVCLESSISIHGCDCSLSMEKLTDET